MSIWIIVGSVILFGGIVFLNKSKPAAKRTRKEFLEELANTLEGHLMVMDNKQECYSIAFEQEELSFVYEDIKDEGFGQESYKAYLRIQSKKNFNLSFVEIKMDGAVKTDIRMASEMIEDDAMSQDFVKLPSSLDDFKVSTGNWSLAKKFLENDQVVKVLNSFKRRSPRGMGLIPLRIIDGEIVFEFEGRDNFLRRLAEFNREIDVLEGYAHQLKIMYDVLEKCEIEE